MVLNPISNAVKVTCPACMTGHLTSESGSTVCCTECGVSFPVRNGVVDLLPESKEPLAAAFMEWEWTGRIYESRWWRRNPLITSFFIGISFESEYKLILQAASIKGDETLLDLACGPGIYTRPLANQLEHGYVVGLDLSFSMLNYAVKRSRAEKIDNILFIRGDALALPFPDNQFDAVNCCGALHLFPYPHVLRKIGSILKPGGRVTVGTLQHTEEGLLTRLREYVWLKSGVHPFSHDELKSLLTEAGFTDIVWHHAKRYYQVVSAMKPR
jgi:SAM-dependent methyltransferase